MFSFLALIILQQRKLARIYQSKTKLLRHGSKLLDVDRLDDVGASREESVGQQPIAFVCRVERVPKQVELSVGANLHYWKTRDGAVVGSCTTAPLVRHRKPCQNIRVNFVQLVPKHPHLGTPYVLFH